MTPPQKSQNPLVIGLTGGVGSGKSAVARVLRGLGFVPIDADDEARRALRERPELGDQIRTRFGESLYRPDGTLDRAALAEVVFGDAEARRDLERIVHPAVRAAIGARLERARAEGRAVVLDVPLLLEGGLIERCDAVLFVEAPDRERIRRVAATRGWDEAELRRREAAQAPLPVKKAAATATIDNSGTLESTRAQVEAILARWRRPGT